MPPAARVTDMHTCPMVTGIVPHVGGPILPPFLPPPGCPPVLIGFLPAARVTDLATVSGPPPRHHLDGLADCLDRQSFGRAHRRSYRPRRSDRPRLPHRNHRRWIAATTHEFGEHRCLIESPSKD